MSHIYSQRTGEMWRGALEGKGYSGHEGGLNNPDAQSFHGVGPLPQGKYFIGEPHDHPTLGPYVLPLIPVPSNDMFGRGSFYIHGDSLENPGAQVASHGCVILPRASREDIWESGDHELTVVAEYPFPVPFAEEEITKS